MAACCRPCQPQQVSTRSPSGDSSSQGLFSNWSNVDWQLMACVQPAPPSEQPPARVYGNAEAVAAVARGEMVAPTLDDMEEYSTLAPAHNLPACDVLAPDDLYADLRTGASLCAERHRLCFTLLLWQF